MNFQWPFSYPFPGILLYPVVVENFRGKFLIYHQACIKIATSKPPIQLILAMSFYFLIKVQSALNIQHKHICLFLS